VVVGYSQSGSFKQRAVLWKNGIETDLGTLGGTSSTAKAINNAGTVVGSSSTSSGSPHAFVWKSGKMTELNKLLPPNSGWKLQYANAINNKGQIVGYGTFQGQTRAFLLTPLKVSP
jgi:probable HAF family extracellular repeat protein